MKSVKKSTVFRLLIELTLYAVLVSVYLVLVLHFLLDWLKELFTKQPQVYAWVAILLMIGQSVGLERLTTGLVHLGRRRKG
jgi:predicted tellurium resistance membrane protein TerC